METTKNMRTWWRLVRIIALLVVGGLCALGIGLNERNQTIGSTVGSPIQETTTVQKQWKVTPLLAAVGAGDIEQVRALLEHGANPDDPAAGRSPLIQAITLPNGKAMRCSLPIVHLLLDHGADPNRADPGIGSLPLLAAFANGDVECALALRDAGAPADSRDSGGHTILHSAVGAAARSGDMTILDTAIRWGIDKNDRAEDGYTALHEAVRVQSVEVIQALLNRGADPCIKNKIGQTPLAMAINLHRNRAIINALSDATHCVNSAIDGPRAAYATEFVTAAQWNKMLADVESRPGTKCLDRDDNQLICAATSPPTIWVFTRPGHPAHPAASKGVMTFRDRAVDIDRTGYYAGDRNTYTAWMEEFRVLDARQIELWKENMGH
jgi:ankyrin repeat protein